MNQPTVAIIIRMAFQKDLTENQIQRFRNMLSSLMFQNYFSHEVYILPYKVRNFLGSSTNYNTIKKNINEMRNLTLGRTGAYILGDSPRFKYDIEIRLDYDDIVTPNFITDIVEQYHARSEETFIVSYQPTIVDVATGDHYRHPSKYSEDCPSMCMALIQKGEKNFGVYDRPHNKMKQEIGCPVVVRPEGFFYLQVHGENTLSKLPGKQYKL